MSRGTACRARIELGEICEGDQIPRLDESPYEQARHAVPLQLFKHRYE
jgi:hypothetical protein